LLFKASLASFVARDIGASLMPLNKKAPPAFTVVSNFAARTGFDLTSPASQSSKKKRAHSIGKRCLSMRQTV
jgi:hypothetical protein